MIFSNQKILLFFFLVKLFHAKFLIALQIQIQCPSRLQMDRWLVVIMMHFTVGQFLLYQISPMSALIVNKCWSWIWAAFWRGEWHTALHPSVWVLLCGIWHRAGLGNDWGENACVCNVFSMFRASVCTGIMLIPWTIRKGTVKCH